MALSALEPGVRCLILWHNTHLLNPSSSLTRRSLRMLDCWVDYFSQFMSSSFRIRIQHQQSENTWKVRLEFYQDETLREKDGIFQFQPEDFSGCHCNDR